MNDGPSEGEGERRVRTGDRIFYPQNNTEKGRGRTACCHMLILRHSAGSVGNKETLGFQSVKLNLTRMTSRPAGKVVRDQG